MATLPLIKIDDQATMLMQSRWKSLLDVILRGQLIDGNLLTNIAISSGNNIINHQLDRQMIGWIVVDQTGAAAVSLYRSAALNDKTLTLNSTGTATISLWVF